MSILSIRSQFLLPEKELIINKSITIRQRPALIASITEQAGIIKLWIFQQMSDSSFKNISEEDFQQRVTNRDDILKRTFRTRDDHVFISEVTIQGVNLKITQSSSSVIGYNAPTHMKLQHFLEAGVDFSSIENVSLDELFLTEYKLAEGIGFPEINTSAHMPVSLKLTEQSREVLIEPSHWFKLEVGKHDISGSFVDTSSGNEIEYHICEIACYDIWTESMKQFQDDEVLRKLKEQGQDDAAIEKMKAAMPDSLSRFCPEGHVLLHLTYECSNDVQLNFYTTEFLLEEPERNGCAVMGIYHSDNEKGKYGNQLLSCLLKTVPEGFNNAVEVELMSWYKKIPSETIDA